MSYASTWKQVILNPNDFYKNMSKTDEYTSPINFVIITLAILSILLGLEISLSFILISPTYAIFGLIALVIVFVILGIIALYLNSAILNYVYKFLDGNGNYKVTFEMLCYAWAPLVIAPIPIIGWFISLYAIYLNIIGGMIVQNISIGKSILACILSYAVVCVLTSIVFGIIVSIILSAFFNPHLTRY